MTSKPQSAGVPPEAVAVQATLVVPTGKKSPGAGVQATVAPVQVPPVVGSGKVTAAPVAPGGAAAVMSPGQETVSVQPPPWAKTGVPCSGAFTATGCGCYNAAASTFTVTVTVPAGFTGPMVVTLNSIGDGWTLPAGTVDTDTVTFAQGGGCTLTVSCPGDMTAAAPPGATGAAVTFPLPTTGGTCTGATVACTPAPGDFFPVGTTAVACTATAAGGTPANCGFDVTVGNQTLQEIPAASALGLGALALLLAGAAFVALRRLG